MSPNSIEYLAMCVLVHPGNKNRSLAGESMKGAPQEKMGNPLDLKLGERTALEYSKL
jgi:hypothetical protein